LIPIFLGAGALYLYARGLKKTLENVKVNLKKVRYNSKDTKDALYVNLHLLVDLAIKNPNNQPANINEIKLAVFNKGRQVANVTRLQPFKILALQETAVTIPVVIPSLSLVSMVWEIIQVITKGDPISLDIKGMVNVEGNIVTFSQNVAFDWKT